MKKLSRRDFLTKAMACGCGVAAWGAFPKLGLSTAFAETISPMKLVLVNLNGGLDGLAALQPRSGATLSALQSMRPTLCLDPGLLLPADGSYGFHPSLTTMKSIFDEGKLLSVLNVGYQNMSRSHLDAEVAFAQGSVDRLTPVSGGFVNRIGANFGWTSLRAISVSGVDRAFEGGDYRGVQVDGLENFYYHGDFSQSSAENNYRVDTMFALSQDFTPDPNKGKQTDAKLGLELAVNNSDIVHTSFQNASFIQNYPSTYMGKQFRDVEIVLRDPTIDAQIGYMRPIGFDTHSGQGDKLDSLLGEFNAALSAFIANLKARSMWDKTIILVFSEFGRTNRENDSEGTDHGGANSVFLLGGKVNGGVLGSVTPSDLNDNSWLPMKYSVVEVYRRILEKMGLDPDAVFDGTDGPSLAGIFS